MLLNLISSKPNMAAAFIWTVRVYYEDTDAGGIVYYANYLKFFERARTEWLRAIDVGQHDLLQEQDAMFVVQSVSADYHAPARLDDVLKLTLSIEKLGRASVIFVQQAWRGEQLLNTARVKVACVDSALRPRAVPAAVAAKMRGASTDATSPDATHPEKTES
ncbi:tol-pal system-associated acyl-CoA thioesterase [Rugamonas sp.]|uniref:tol-pal system-associated acyl-CoA thioesterase n=1 Tax=Rugamonas sp. TaxID=1926287 RepID=UPI0025FA7653|nr:tol-pal system-associated acyl-CoA thioesterase [Rugamonas sp.]